MATVLLTAEFGGGSAARAVVTVARALAGEGHQPVLAPCDVTEPAPLLARETWPVLQAPYWHPHRGDGPAAPADFAGLLAARGWDRADHLRPLVESWQRLLEAVRPRAVIAYASPTACLAAF